MTSRCHRLWRLWGEGWLDGEAEARCSGKAKVPFPARPYPGQGGRCKLCHLRQVSAAPPAVAGESSGPSGQTTACWEPRHSGEKWAVHVCTLEPLCLPACADTVCARWCGLLCTFWVCVHGFCVCLSGVSVCSVCVCVCLNMEEFNECGKCACPHGLGAPCTFVFMALSVCCVTIGVACMCMYIVICACVCACLVTWLVLHLFGYISSVCMLMPTPMCVLGFREGICMNHGPRMHLSRYVVYISSGCTDPMCTCFLQNHCMCVLCVC